MSSDTGRHEAPDPIIHDSWHYRLPKRFQDPALADLASRPSPEKADRADFPAGSDLSDGERTDHALEPADYRTVLSRLRGSSRGSTLRPSYFEGDV